MVHDMVEVKSRRSYVACKQFTNFWEFPHFATGGSVLRSFFLLHDKNSSIASEGSPLKAHAMASKT